ncbi:MAG: LPS export ABC transporter ATP-binding protein [Candidatus Mucispirillum faecigallinarum]|nr:LPS export ABC transporter ATP-binding protein [Candidatus Mucispirillum faecigallinarum]
MALEVKDLKKSFKKRTVVNGVSLNISKGEIVGLLGPNGAGKSTSFYMIVGLLKPEAGSIILDGEEITKMPMYKRCKAGIGYLPQEASVFRKMTVYDNIMAALEFTYDDDKIKKEKADILISEFHLNHVAKSYGYALSGGERRRVEIARCLATEPDFILLDEPFAGIDPISVSDIQEMVYSLKDMDIGVLITDHNVRDTLKITDRGYIITEGRVLTQGSPSEILSNKDVIDKYLGKGFSI